MSMPASANAALAATEPAEMHPSSPSFSMMVTKTSIVDFGNNSSRTAESSACCICTPTERSSASCRIQSDTADTVHTAASNTDAYRCSPFLARERRKLDLYVQPALLAICCGPRLPWSIPSKNTTSAYKRNRHFSTTHTAQAILVFSVSIYADPFA